MGFAGRHGHDAEHGLFRGTVHFGHQFDALHLAVPFDFHGDDVMAVRCNGLGNIGPLGNILIADTDDAVACRKACLFRRRTGNGRADDGFWRYRHRTDGKEQSPQEEDGQDEVHDPAGSDDDHALPDGFVEERLFIQYFIFGHAGNAVEPAERDGPQGIFCITAAYTVHFGTKTECELIDLHPCPLGRREMAQFMDEDDDTEDEDRR